MTPLRKKMEADLRIRGMSQSTSTLYLHCVRRYAEYHGRSPALMDTEQVRQYLLHLRDIGRTPATIVVYRAALLFVYKVTLLRPAHRDHAAVADGHAADIRMCIAW